MGYFEEQAKKLQRLVGARYHHALHTPYPEMMETGDVRFERAAIESALREVARKAVEIGWYAPDCNADFDGMVDEMDSRAHGPKSRKEGGE